MTSDVQRFVMKTIFVSPTVFIRATVVTAVFSFFLISPSFMPAGRVAAQQCEDPPCERPGSESVPSARPSNRPSNPPAVHNRKKKSSTVSINPAEQALARGNAYLAQRQYADAATAYQEAISLRSSYAEAYSNLSYAYVAQRKLDDAEKAANSALELDPSLASAVARLGHVYRLRRKSAEAKAQYQRAMNMAPNYAEPHHGLGMLYSDLRRHQEAIAEFQRAIALNPKWSDPHYYLGLVYRSLRQDSEAASELQRAANLDPNWPFPHNGLGNVYRDLKRYSEAVAEYQRAITLDSQSATTHNNLGSLYYYYNQGSHGAAIDEYQKAINLSPNMAWPHFNLGVVYSQDGLQDQAKAEFQKYLEHAPKRRNQGIEMIWIPSGTFMMGWTDAEARSAYEDSKRYKSDTKLESFTAAGPKHQVTIRDGFWMGRNEITQAQWKSIMGTTVGQQRDKVNPSFAIRGEGDNYPMYYVSWNEAKEFIQKLNQMNDVFTYRLPTEAEWEYAARAGTTTTYFWGEDLIGACQYGNVVDQVTKEKEPTWTMVDCRDQYAEMSPVGSFKPNNFGLYDVIGNVEEWCEDSWQHSYAGAPTDGSAWLTGSKWRVARGGSWNDYPYTLRSAYHTGSIPILRSVGIGFRVVAVPRPQ